MTITKQITYEEFYTRYEIIKNLPEMDQNTFTFTNVINPNISGSCTVIVSYNPILNTWLIAETKTNN